MLSDRVGNYAINFGRSLFAKEFREEIRFRAVISSTFSLEHFREEKRGNSLLR